MDRDTKIMITIVALGLITMGLLWGANDSVKRVLQTTAPAPVVDKILMVTGSFQVVKIAPVGKDIMLMVVNSGISNGSSFNVPAVTDVYYKIGQTVELLITLHYMGDNTYRLYETQLLQ